MNAVATSEGRWRVIGFCEKVYQACPGAPVQGAGTCERCGQGIRYVVTLKHSVTGETLCVGQDCAVTLEGGVELQEIRRAEREYERELYLKSPAYAAKVAKEKREKEEADHRASVAETECALMLACLRLIESSPNLSSRDHDAASSQIALIRRGLSTGPKLVGHDGEHDREREERGQWQARMKVAMLPPIKKLSVGVGQKFEVDAVFEAFIPIESMYGASYIQKFRALDGSAIVWFSRGGSLCRDDIGETVKIRGTVKEHGEYNGAPQTTVTRCKIADEKKGG